MHVILKQSKWEIADYQKSLCLFATFGVTQAFLVLSQGLTILGTDAKKSQQAFLAPLPRNGS